MMLLYYRVGQGLELWELPRYIEESKYNATAVVPLPFDALLRPLPAYLIFGGNIAQVTIHGITDNRWIPLTNGQWCGTFVFFPVLLNRTRW